MPVRVPIVHGYGTIQYLTRDDPCKPGATVVYRSEKDQSEHCQENPGKLAFLTVNPANSVSLAMLNAGFGFASVWREDA